MLVGSRAGRLLRFLVAVALLVSAAVFNVAISDWFVGTSLPRWSGWIAVVALVMLVGATAWQVWQVPKLGGRDGEGSWEELDSGIRAVSGATAGGEVARLVALDTTVPLEVLPDLQLVHDPSRPDIDIRTIGSVEEALAGSEGRLLLVGEPGSGKTIAAYQLVGHLLTQDPPVTPMVVNLSAWDDQDSFEEFLVDYVVGGAGWYEGVGGTNREQVRRWLQRGKVALVLDGLDEVGTTWRADCLAKLEQWAYRNQVVLTCRKQKYDQLLQQRDGRGVQLYLGVELQPLNDIQLARALTAFDGDRWRQLAQPWRDQPGQQAVRDALRNPLLLNLARRSRISIDELLAAGPEGKDAVASRIIDAYLSASLADDEPLARWATWIAAYLLGQQPTGSEGLAPPQDATVFHLS